MISQGSSEISISCVVQADEALKALNVVHHKLLTPPPAGGVLGGGWAF